MALGMRRRLVTRRSSLRLEDTTSHFYPPFFHSLAPSLFSPFPSFGPLFPFEWHSDNWPVQSSAFACSFPRDSYNPNARSFRTFVLLQLKSFSRSLPIIQLLSFLVYAQGIANDKRLFNIPNDRIH
jgi:hypothetical protein